MPRRFDRSTLKGARRLPNGYLRSDAHLTRTGVFIYQNQDGTTRRELRLPEEVFHGDSLSSFSLVPLTNDHPPEGLTAKNTRQYQVGNVGESVTQDGEFVLSTVQITDEATIADVESGKVELSCGYDCDLEMTPGVHGGERYDAVQRKIRGNHVALVDKGRAGRQARLHMDTDSAEMIESESQTKDLRAMDKVKIIINGEEIEVSAAVAEELKAWLKSKMGGGQPVDQTSGGGPTVNKVDEAARAEIVKLRADKDAIAAKLDAFTSKEAQAERARKDTEYRAKVAQEIRVRLDLDAKAQKILGSEYKSEGKTDREVQSAIIEKLAPGTKLDGYSDEYVRGRLDAQLGASSSDVLDRAREVASGGAQNQDTATKHPDTEDGHRDGMIEEQAKRGSAPLTFGISRK